ncbi:spartin-like isoform X2 [Ornithodoros turicata]|uniref:spartin-like isoform X2 n=1 Tax=Ornithodoros turicata TaxID=34597 RepID=UPI003139169D
MQPAQHSASQDKRDLETLQKAHDEAFLYISQGLSCEECGQTTLAGDTYRRGLERLDQALQISCDGRAGPQWDNARKMQNKMLRVKTEVEIRMRAANGERSGETMTDNPPSYEDAIAGISCVDVTLNGGVTAEVLMYVPRGVQVFYVSPTGEVGSPSSPSDLTVYRLKDEPDKAIQRRLSWLQAGSWIYPLLPGQAPALRTGFGAYMFPDIDADKQGAAVGILLPSDTSTETQILFESLMENLTAIKIEPLIIPGAEPTFGQKVSESLIAGSQCLSAGICKSAEVTCHALGLGVQKLKEYIKPEQQPVDPRVKVGFQVLRQITGSIRSVSGYVVNKVGDLSLVLAQEVAKKVTCDPPILPCETVDGGGGGTSSTVNEVLTIAKGGIQGLSTLYLGLEKASGILAAALADGSVQIIGHKYGKDAAEVVSDALCSVGNVALATQDVRSLHVKAVAKRTARETGKAVLLEYLGRKRIAAAAAAAAAEKTSESLEESSQ